MTKPKINYWSGRSCQGIHLLIENYKDRKCKANLKYMEGRNGGENIYVLTSSSQMFET